MANPSLFRVNGEIGRFSFRTHRVESNGHVVFDTAADMFGRLRPKEYYMTVNMEELVLSLSSDLSYRKVTSLVNRVRREDSNPMPLMTLADVVERAGARIGTQIKEWAEEVLAEHHFSKDGVPEEPIETDQQATNNLVLPESVVAEAIAAFNATRPETLHIPPEAGRETYENPQQSVNVSLDDVGAKKKKLNRVRKTKATEAGELPKTADSTEESLPFEKAAKKPREYVHNTIAHIETTHGQYILDGHGTVDVLRLLIAFLLHTKVLYGYSLQFFVDGQRTLQAAIVERLAWFTQKRIILDWFHLREKCSKELSTVLQGRVIRNKVLGHLLPLLWMGRLDRAIDYLRSLDSKSVKHGYSVEGLIGYFERNRAYIPCYALRKQLGLRNSSNRGEKANDLCVAGRQKHQGMSWSATGSLALTSISVARQNGELLHWCRHHKLSFKWAA